MLPEEPVEAGARGVSSHGGCLLTRLLALSVGSPTSLQLDS